MPNPYEPFFSDKGIHLINRVDEDPERIPSESLKEVRHMDKNPRVPGLTRIRQGQHVLAVPGGSAQQAAKIGVTTYYAIEGDDVHIGKLIRNIREVGVNERDSLPMSASGGFLPGFRQVR